MTIEISEITYNVLQSEKGYLLQHTPLTEEQLTYDTIILSLCGAVRAVRGELSGNTFGEALVKLMRGE